MTHPYDGPGQLADAKKTIESYRFLVRHLQMEQQRLRDKVRELQDRLDEEKPASTLLHCCYGFCDRLAEPVGVYCAKHQPMRRKR
jgi:hypothetical protein